MNPRALLMPVVLVMSLFAVACDADEKQTRPEPSAAPASQGKDKMKIKLKLENKTLTATLHDTPSARDFASMLPLTLTLEDYNNTEKVSDLPRKLTTEGVPAGVDPSVGDIAYYAPWGNLAIFYKDFGYSNGLVLLGKLDGAVETLSISGPLKVTIELVK